MVDRQIRFFDVSIREGRINKLYLLAYLHTMALSFLISLFVAYTDIANRQTTNIFFGFLGSHSSKKKRGKRKNMFLTFASSRLEGPTLWSDWSTWFVISGKAKGAQVQVVP